MAWPEGAMAAAARPRAIAILRAGSMPGLSTNRWASSAEAITAARVPMVNRPLAHQNPASQDFALAPATRESAGITQIRPCTPRGTTEIAASTSAWVIADRIGDPPQELEGTGHQNPGQPAPVGAKDQDRRRKYEGLHHRGMGQGVPRHHPGDDDGGDPGLAKTADRGRLARQARPERGPENRPGGDPDEEPRDGREQPAAKHGAEAGLQHVSPDSQAEQDQNRGEDGPRLSAQHAGQREQGIGCKLGADAPAGKFQK